MNVVIKAVRQLLYLVGLLVPFLLGVKLQHETWLMMPNLKLGLRERSEI